MLAPYSLEPSKGVETDLIKECMEEVLDFLKILFIERGEEREKEQERRSMPERNIHGLPLPRTTTGN